MVWIHGGALKLGFASDFGTAGTVRNLVSRGVVVVTIQYRLGVLGILKKTFDFFNFTFLGFFTTHTDDFPPNLGMLDQVDFQKNIRV
jgi:carboxylesterase type B